MVRFAPYTDAAQLAFLRQLKALTPVQLITVLVFLQLQQTPDRGKLVQRIIGA
jgi:hypothetical protein